jgi:hypothetical protein
VHKLHTDQPRHDSCSDPAFRHRFRPLIPTETAFLYIPKSCPALLN